MGTSFTLSEGRKGRAVSERTILGKRLRRWAESEHLSWRKVLSPRALRVKFSGIRGASREMSGTTEANRKEGGFRSEGCLYVRGRGL